MGSKPHASAGRRSTHGGISSLHFKNNYNEGVTFDYVLLVVRAMQAMLIPV